MILKIVGITLAILIGIVLLLLLLVLFVPVRYTAYIKKEDEVNGKGNFHWLFHILHAKVLYENNETKFCVRLLGIPIIQSDKPKRVKNKKPKKKTPKKTVSKDKKAQRQKKISESNKVLLEKKTLVQEKNDKVQRENTVETAKRSSKNKSSNKKKSQAKKNSLFWRIKDKILNIIKSVKNFFEKLRNVWSSFHKYKKKIIEFLKDEQHKNAFLKGKKSLLGLLKYLGPQKVKGNILYGTGDPCSTGLSLGAASILYAKYGNNIKIRPDFENKVFLADVKISGRVRLFRLIWVLFKTYLDKDIKALINHGKKLKEEF